MDDKEYLALLDRAWLKIPEGFHETERWQIPKAEIQMEGKYTIITNFMDIVNTIKRDDKEFLRYLLNELGTSGEVRSQKAYLKSAQKVDNINRHIEIYCKKYVICPTCNKPDTKLVRENRGMMIHCSACGTNTIVK